jgi:ABC-type nitrate/sulfonate/bicarbonate transport system ATPase subunit
MKLPLILSVVGPSARRQAAAPAAEVDAGRILIDGVNLRYSRRHSVPSRTATTNRAVLVVTHDRDLAAIADRVVTLASPGPRGRPGSHRNTGLQQEGRG